MKRLKYHGTAYLLFDWFVYDQCDQIGQFIGLWATYKALGNN